MTRRKTDAAHLARAVARLRHAGPSVDARTPTAMLRVAALAAAAAVLTGCQGMTGAPQAGTNQTSVLTLFAPQSPAELAREAVDPFDADKRQRGLTGLANQPFGGEDVYLGLYRLGLDDQDAAVRVAALRALGRHGEIGDAALVAEHLDDEQWLVRWEAARSLQRLHDPDLVASLISLLDPTTEEFAPVRAAAAEALGQYEQARVLDALIAALDDADFAVVHASMHSLHVLTGERLGDDLANWLDWLAQTGDPFAGGETYIYTAYERDARWYEWINPFFTVPNEVASSPVGMPARSR